MKPRQMGTYCDSWYSPTQYSTEVPGTVLEKRQHLALAARRGTGRGCSSAGTSPWRARTAVYLLPKNSYRLP